MNFLNLFNKNNQNGLLEHLPDAVIVTDTLGQIKWVNEKAAYIFEAEKEVLLNINLDDIIYNGKELTEKSIRRRTPYVAGAISPSTKEFFIELNASEIRENYVVTVRDVTAMTKLLVNAEKTGKLNKEKNIMLVKLSNEIKSPIQSIIGFSQALIDGLGGEINEKQAKYAKIINKNSGELLYFTDKIMELSYSESSMFESDIQTFDVVNAIQSVIKNNELLFLNKNLVVNFESEGLPKKAVYTDETALKTVLQDLIEIAVKSTEVGSITISALNPDLELVKHTGLRVPENATEKSYLLITVSDTGAGLGEHELDDLFDPYNQLDKVNKKNIVRSIILGTVNTIISRMKGVIWAQSEVMKGTTFNIIIPIEKGLEDNE